MQPPVQVPVDKGNKLVTLALYSGNKFILLRKFQQKVKPLPCSHGRGQIVLPHAQALVDILVRDNGNRFGSHDIPLISCIFDICQAVLLPNQDGTGRQTDGGVTISLISTLFAIIMRRKIDDFSKVERMLEIMKLVDIDKDGYLTVGEIFNALFMTESLAGRLHRAKPILIDTPEMAAVLATKFATKLTSIIVQSAYPECEDFRRHLHEHSQYLISLDEIRASLEKNPFFLESLPNPAALDVDLFVPTEVCKSAKSVADHVIALIAERESAKIRLVRYGMFLDLLRSTESDDEFFRAKHMLRGLELLRAVPEGATEGSVHVPSYSMCHDPEFENLCEIIRFSFAHFAGCKTSRTEYASIPPQSIISEFCSVGGVTKLERIGRTGLVPPHIQVPVAPTEMQPVKLFSRPFSELSSAKNRLAVAPRRSISGSSIIYFNSQLSVCFDGRSCSSKQSSKKSSVTYAPKSQKTSSSAHVFCIVCDGYHA